MDQKLHAADRDRTKHNLKGSELSVGPTWDLEIALSYSTRRDRVQAQQAKSDDPVM